MNNVSQDPERLEMTLETEFLNILKTKQLSIYFQPIMHFQSNNIYGYEALSRGPKNSFFHKPAQLFPYAEKHGMLYSLEKLARECAFEESKGNLNGRKLFININPQVIYDNNFNTGHTISLLKHYGISPTDIVFEITERNAIQDFGAFRNVLNHYREQGFQIAVDDAGAGYSSLQAISELMPDYIKIDRSLISEIHQHDVKAHILEAFVTFAKKMNSKIIAEGIETKEECQRVVELGIEYGQGYFIAKPSSSIPSITPSQFTEKIKRICMKRSVTIDLSDEIILKQKGIEIDRFPASSLIQLMKKVH